MYVCVCVCVCVVYSNGYSCTGSTPYLVRQMHAKSASSYAHKNVVLLTIAEPTYYAEEIAPQLRGSGQS